MAGSLQETLKHNNMFVYLEYHKFVNIKFYIKVHNQQTEISKTSHI